MILLQKIVSISSRYSCDRKARGACALSFALWQQATIEFTRRHHSIITCSRHIYVLLFFAHIPFVVNHTFNATPPERLQLLRSEIPSGMCANIRTVAASNNRDDARNLSYYCLLALHIWWWSNICIRSRHPEWVTMSTYDMVRGLSFSRTAWTPRIRCHLPSV